MKTKIDKQKELINLLGNNYNSINNLVRYLNGKYNPKYFKNFKEFCAYSNIKNQSIDDYTDNYISENDNYLVILFNDYRDFKGANKNDNFSDDIIVCYDKETNKIIKYYYTGVENEYLYDIDAFIN